MRPVRAFFVALSSAFLDALFPIPPAEREVLAMDPAAALTSLPRAPRAPIPEACSIFAYGDERVSRLIWSVKYKKSRPGARLAGYALYYMARRWMRAIPGDMRIVIAPMPITPARRRERGFNQCELIMEEMRKLDMERHFLFAPDLLKRVRHTSRQTMKDRAGRLESAEDLFAVNEKAAEKLAPHAERAMHASRIFIVVIDDVVTTGSTIKDAIYTLRRAGFENTYGLSVAH